MAACCQDCLCQEEAWLYGWIMDGWMLDAVNQAGPQTLLAADSAVD